jgi:hypothetical protein
MFQRSEKVRYVCSARQHHSGENLFQGPSPVISRRMLNIVHVIFLAGIPYY